MKVSLDVSFPSAQCMRELAKKWFNLTPETNHVSPSFTVCFIARNSESNPFQGLLQISIIALSFNYGALVHRLSSALLMCQFVLVLSEQCLQGMVPLWQRTGIWEWYGPKVYFGLWSQVSRLRGASVQIVWGHSPTRLAQPGKAPRNSSSEMYSEKPDSFLAHTSESCKVCTCCLHVTCHHACCTTTHHIRPKQITLIPTCSHCSNRYVL